MKTQFEQNGGTYSEVNGYLIPNLVLSEQPEYHIGIWGHRRLNYLKKHKKNLYTVLLTQDKLNLHLHKIDTTAHERWELIIKQMMEAQDVTEQLKAENSMKWVGLCNNIRACANEIIFNEIIYD